MGLIAKLILSCLAIAISAWLTPGVALPEYTSGAGIATLVIVAVVLALLNTFIKPIIKLLALPVTMITLGLFLLVINALIILMCAWIVDAFVVDGFVPAFVFSVILSVITWLLNKIF
ncbi:MAG: phage holin family protein [Muribaculaceae bacterium]